jgi:hypothetical protein
LLEFLHHQEQVLDDFIITILNEVCMSNCLYINLIPVHPELELSNKNNSWSFNSTSNDCYYDLEIRDDYYSFRIGVKSPDHFLQMLQIEENDLLDDIFHKVIDFLMENADYEFRQTLSDVWRLEQGISLFENFMEFEDYDTVLCQVFKPMMLMADTISGVQQCDDHGSGLIEVSPEEFYNMLPSLKDGQRIYTAFPKHSDNVWLDRILIEYGIR